MRLKEKIEEVNNLIKEYIINGEFEFITCNEHTAKIKIENEFFIELWIANDPKYSFEVWRDTLSIIERGEEETKIFKTQKDRLAGWQKIKPFVENHRRKVLKRQKQKQINRLKKELEQLENPKTK